MAGRLNAASGEVVAEDKAVSSTALSEDGRFVYLRGTDGNLRKVTPEGARKIARHKMDIRPGMPVELFVKTGERTMMNYLLKPIIDRAHSAMSED